MAERDDDEKVLILCCAILSLTACVQKDNYDITVEDEEQYYYQAELFTENEIIEYEPSYEHLPDPVDIYADFNVIPNPDGSFIIETTLPGQTELSLKLQGRGYLAQGKAFVEDGTAVSEPFTNRGEPLRGDFTLEVLMPIVSVQNDYVKHFTGKNGEYLTGPYVKGALGSVIVSKEFNVSFPVNTTVDSTYEEDSYEYPVYYRTPSGKRYHLDPDCCGENGYAITDVTGLKACGKCAG